MDGCWYSDPLASLPRPATCPCDYCKGRREGKTLQADNAPSSADSARRRPNVIASLRRLLAEATPAPWTNQGYDKHEEGWCLLGGGVPFSAEEHMVAYTPGFSPRAAEDAALMCELRNRADDWLALYDAAEEFRTWILFDNEGAEAKLALATLDAALARLSDEALQ